MTHPVATEVFAPAKVNVFLGVTGVQEDGYHSLLSWVMPLSFGDAARIELAPRDALIVEGISVDCSLGNNLAWKALQVFRSRAPQLPPVRITLTKRIPFDAGLGGGSSDAVAALKGFNELIGNVLSLEVLSDLAASLGSDCPLFLAEGSSVIRGRGEQVEPLDQEIFPPVRLLLFKPFLGVDTPWAYGQLRAKQQYIEPEEAETRLEACLNTFGQGDYSFYNSFELVVFDKMPGLALLIENLRSEGVACSLSGSGSACFAIAKKDADIGFIHECVNRCWGPNAFIVETSPLS